MEDFLSNELTVIYLEMTYNIGNFLGLNLTQQGATILMSGTSMEIAEGSSRIRLFMVTMMFAAIFANATQRLLWKKLLLFFSAIPFLILGNTLFMLFLLTLSKSEKEHLARSLFHDGASLLIIIPIITIGLLLVSKLLASSWRRHHPENHSR